MDRVQRLLAKALAYEPELCLERARLFTETFRETEGEPLIIRRAKAFARVLDEMTIYINPEELIVGGQAAKPRAAPLFPEYSVGWIMRELEDFPTRPLDPFLLPENFREEFTPIHGSWNGRTHQDNCLALTRQVLPPKHLEAYDLQAYSLNQVVSNASHISTGDGHIIVGYGRLIAEGLDASIALCREKEAALDNTRPEDQEKKFFYRAATLSLEAAVRFAERYADLARRLAREEHDPGRRAELERIAAVCARVPGQPARDFWEALQALAFIQLIIQIEGNGHSISLGRLDQYLAPYYERDLAAGRITREEALELIALLFIKQNEQNKVREWAYTQFTSGYPMFQTVTLGGQDAGGMDATNEVSYLALEATARLKLPQPTVCVRLHSHADEEFVAAAVECLERHGGGLPGFFNDEVTIPMLLNMGVPLEEARDWAVMGCSEPQVPGKFCPSTSGVCHVNLLKAFEIALNGGVNPANGRRLGPGGTGLPGFQSMEEVWDAYREQVEFYAPFVPVLDNITAKSFEEIAPTPFLSACVDGRLAYGRDITLECGPHYNNQLVLVQGATNVGNSMAALEKLVFEEGSMDAAELHQALLDNFEGPQGEVMRQRLINAAPKYGNDNAEIDRYARRALEILLDVLRRHTPRRGGVFGPSTQTNSGNVPMGRPVGATPDGRRAGEPLADNSSPSPGTDVNGPTSAMKSVARLPHELISNGTIFNMKFHPSTLEGSAGIAKFGNLIRGFFDLKGFQVQFNIISPETLRDAQEHPEQYPNLVVKVAGYSAMFHTLDRKLQDQIILRTTHQL